MNVELEIQKNLLTGIFSMLAIVGIVYSMVEGKLPTEIGMASEGFIIMLFGFLIALIVDVVMIIEDVRLIEDLKQI